MAAQPANPIPATQSKQSFDLSHRTGLVTIDFVRASRGVDADAINAMVDAGELRWVWDVSAGLGKVRALRFCPLEITAPETTCKLTPPAAVRMLLGGDRARWRGVEIAQLLLVSRPQIMRLRKTEALPGNIMNGTLYVTRPMMERFLTRRLVFNS